VPLTVFQKYIFKLIAKHRSPESHVAGGTAINYSDSSVRYSKDIDIFHDTQVQVQLAYATDRKIFLEDGCTVTTLLEQPGFVRVIVSKDGDSVTLEWLQDSSFRFFPVIEDALLGYRLHDVDLATNKCLALANRQEVRDVIDLVQFHENVLSLPGICWAACGKDEGFTPDLLLDLLLRNSKINRATLSIESLTIPLDPVAFKQRWVNLIRDSQQILAEFPASQMGCLYLDEKRELVRSPNPQKLASYTPHFGSVRGCWPRAC
jgi:hypothetical protein